MVATIMALSCGKEVVTKEVIKEAEPKLSVSCFTGSAVEIESTSAKISGMAAIVNASAQNGSSAFYYSASAPASAQALKVASKIEAGNIDKDGGLFSVALGNLQPKTKYYYVACVQIDEEEFLGKVESFTTTETPVELVTSGAATEITVMSAKLSGYANPTQGITDVSFGIIVSQNEDNLDGGTVYVAEGLDGNQEFSVIANGLSSNSQYYYKSFIQYSDKQGDVCRYGESRSFTTSVVEATVETKDAADVVEHNATLRGIVAADEDLNKEAWFLYSKTYSTLDDLLNNGSRAIANIEEDGSFECDIKSLESGEEYFFVAVARVYDRIFYGAVKTFGTADNTTIKALNAQSMYSCAVLTGLLIVDNNNEPHKQAGFYYSSFYASRDGIVTNGNKSDAVLNGEVFTSILKGLKEGTTYYCIPFAIVNGHSFYGDEVLKIATKKSPEGSVAMGTALSHEDGTIYEVCWAKQNVGATAPEEYGRFVPWGDADIYYSNPYGWPYYKWCDGGSGLNDDGYNTLTKYNTESSFGVVDDRIVLDTSDDVACVHLGGGWRIPTVAEWTELCNQCSWTHKLQAGVNGALIENTSNGNSIFLPAGGFKYGIQYWQENNSFNYWTSSLDIDSPNKAWAVMGYCTVAADPTIYQIPRYRGLSIRPVIE